MTEANNDFGGWLVEGNPILSACDLMDGGARWYKEDLEQRKRKYGWGQVKTSPNPLLVSAKDVFGNHIVAMHEKAYRYNALGAIIHAVDGYNSWKYSPALQAMVLAIDLSLTVDRTTHICHDLMQTEIYRWNNGKNMDYATVRKTMHRAAGLYEEVKGRYGV